MRLRFGVTVGLVGSALAGLIALACGIEEGGVVDALEGGADGGADGGNIFGDGSADVIRPKDAAIDTNLPPSCGDAAACLPPVPTGWQILTVLPDPDAGCPQNFNQADLQGNPTLDPSACACACTETADAGCPTSVALNYNNVVGCFANGQTTVVLDAGCTAISDGKKDWFFGVKTTAATGINCSAPAKIGSQTGAGTTMRVCQPTCNADFCGSAVNGTRACIMTTDDVPCPAQFPVKSLVGSALDFVCNACPACTPKAATCAVSVQMHGQSDCTDGNQFSVSTNGVCNKWGGTQSWKGINTTITPPAGPFCAYTASDPGGDAGFVGPRTICCTK